VSMINKCNALAAGIVCGDTKRMEVP